MADTTFEEAKRCFGCRQPGKVAQVKEIPQGQVHVFECDNERCLVNGERWLVQTNPDGSIPQHTAGPKNFPQIKHYTLRAQEARDSLKVIAYMDEHPGMTFQEAVRALGG